MKTIIRVVAFVVVAKVVWVGACLSLPDDVGSRLDYVAGRLTTEQSPGVSLGDEVIDGEWRLGAMSMAAAAAAQRAALHPDETQHWRDVVLGLVARAGKREAAAFDRALWNSDPLQTLAADEGHAGYLGHYAFILSAACSLGGAAAVPRLRQVADALARRLDASVDGLIETYPGQKWIPDTAVVAAALAQTDRCLDEHRYAETLTAWRTRVAAHWTDRATGLWAFSPGVRPRASGSMWTIYYLAFVDEGAARAQWNKAVTAFAQPLPLGLVAFREFLPGVAVRSDVDSGPTPFGISTSGTGFAMAGAARFGDERMRGGLARTAEVAGFSFGLSRRYLTAPLVGDAIVLAMRTAGPWAHAPLSGMVPRHATNSALGPPRFGRLRQQ